MLCQRSSSCPEHGEAWRSGIFPSTPGLGLTLALFAVCYLTIRGLWTFLKLFPDTKTTSNVPVSSRDLRRAHGVTVGADYSVSSPPPPPTPVLLLPPVAPASSSASAGESPHWHAGGDSEPWSTGTLSQGSRSSLFPFSFLLLVCLKQPPHPPHPPPPPLLLPLLAQLSQYLLATSVVGGR